jgi:hypothetical protein
VFSRPGKKYVNPGVEWVASYLGLKEFSVMPWAGLKQLQLIGERKSIHLYLEAAFRRFVTKQRNVKLPKLKSLP